MSNTEITRETNLIGSFYLKLTTHGNLVGEYCNNMSDIISTESAIKINAETDFTGTYHSTWYDTEVHLSKLVIEKRSNINNNRILTLNWFERDQRVYTGEGFQVDDKLIGFYRPS